MEAAANESLRHLLGGAAKLLGEKGLSEGGVAPGRYPPGAFQRDRAALITDREPRNRISWMAGLLPHMGHQNLFQKIQFNQSWRDASNWMPGNTIVPQFLDPTYPDNTQQVAVGELPLDFAATHFVGIAGVGLDAASYKRGDPATAHKRGPLSYDDSASLDEIRAGRGLSNTILMVQVPHDGVTGVSPWIAGGGATLRGVPETNSIAPFVLSTDRNKNTIMYSTDGGKTKQRGTFVLMTDGSVRFIDQTIDEEVFKAMCTVGGPTPKDFDLKKNPKTLLVPPPDPKTREPDMQRPVKIDTGKKPALSKAIEEDQAALRGEWIVKSIELDAQPAPPQLVKAMVFIFQADKVTVRGIPGKEKPSEDTYTIEPTKTPKQIIVKDGTTKKLSYGIYEFDRDDLRICIRDDDSTKGFPSTFATAPNTELQLIVLTRKK
jgi:uncharacterized protein (TIGR03067 family)